jgi:hypothetical protein
MSEVEVTLTSPSAFWDFDVLYFGKFLPSVSEETVSSIFRAEQYPILKMEAARSFETLDANLPNYKASHPSKR